MITACTNGHGGRRCDVCIAWDAAMAAARIAIAPRPALAPMPRTKPAVYQRILREKRISQGLCVGCEEPVASRIYCEDCLRDQRERARKRYHERVQAGQCPWCRAPSTHGVLCKRHYDLRTSVGVR